MSIMAAAKQTVKESPAPLTAQDRCDRCGARATSRHRFKTGELLLCGHHSAQHGEKMLETEIS